MTHLLGIPGSLRKGSFNRTLLQAMADLAPAGCTVEVASIAGIPLYDADVEKSDGVPEAVEALKERFAAADGLLFATPEYNNSIPGVFKNAIDWLSRPPADVSRLFADRPVALCGASPGPGGTRLAQLAWLPVLRTLGMRPWFGQSLALARAQEAFGADGRLRDEKLRETVRRFLAGFVRFVSPEKS